MNKYIISALAILLLNGCSNDSAGSFSVEEMVAEKRSNAYSIAEEIKILEEHKGFVYNLNTFELESEFSYNRSKEGWGLTHSETELIKSDGTSKIWFLDSSSQKEKATPLNPALPVLPMRWT